MGSDFYETIDIILNDENNSLYFIDYFIFLINDYPNIINIYNDSYLPVYFYYLNRLDISHLILNKVFEHFSTNLIALHIYINDLISDIMAINSNRSTINDLNNLIKLLDFIGENINKLNNLMFYNTRSIIERLKTVYRKLISSKESSQNEI